jgi:hypothetical protein
MKERKTDEWFSFQVRNSNTIQGVSFWQQNCHLLKNICLTSQKGYISVTSSQHA